MSLKEPALKDVIAATQADLRANPEHANAIFAEDLRLDVDTEQDLATARALLETESGEADLN